MAFVGAVPSQGDVGPQFRVVRQMFQDKFSSWLNTRIVSAFHALSTLTTLATLTALSTFPAGLKGLVV